MQIIFDQEGVRDWRLVTIYEGGIKEIFSTGGQHKGHLYYTVYRDQIRLRRRSGRAARYYK